MKKKAIISLVLIAVMAFGVGAGSYAWFTSSATSSNNVFTTGNLHITGPGDNMVASYNVPTNIYPSWTSGPRTVTITNDGTLDLRYRMSLVPPTGLNPEQQLLLNSLQIKVTKADGTDTGFVSLGAFAATEIGTILAPATGTTSRTGIFTVEFKLPETVGDELNKVGGVTNALSFKFDATQTNPTATY